ncbi:carboxypeptidase regulatory-like domain-containing protein [Pyxidicoccus parkwayensis]|uniref:Carboxypeptidase regulatory-like domain-containing protein n=1 Tax=Pyxidicoccus parkwayensis TaxID=2813578 RepID=A0ABX7NNJ0_9BACT|nr:carboxypeptidase regulatory-like domain-containing protein [Pyxidicoccus parkwaysis]QSQ20412.1 carboxypeptidase regulatory-like domain-containing protein [Pyxidicoccus parkwaysis]
MRPILRVLLPCLVLVLVRCTPAAPAAVDAGAPDAGARHEVPGTLRVRVLGPDGAPLASSHVQLVSSSLDAPTVWLQTDDHGEAGHPIASSGHHRVFAFWLEKGRFQRYAWKDVELRPGTGDPRVELRFASASVPPISGQVKGLDGLPVEGATVEAFQHFTSVPLDDDLLRNTTGPRETATTTTDAEGRFTVQPLREGEYGLSVVHDKGLGDVTAHTGGPAADIVLIPRCVRSASGRVVDEQGAPIPRFQVDSRRVRDAKGRFTLQGGCFVHIEAPGFVPQRLPLLSLKALHVELPDVVLARARQLSGRVVGPDSKPAGGVALEASWDGDTTNPTGESEETSGRFSLGPVPVGREVTVLAKRADGSLRRRVAADETAPLVIELPADDSRLDVLVKDASGKALGGADVEARGAWGSVTLRTDATGHAAGKVPSGSYEVHVTHQLRGLPDQRRVAYRFAPVTVQVARGNDTPVEVRPMQGTGRLRVLLPEPSHYNSIFVIPGAHEVPANIRSLGARVEHPLVADAASDKRAQYSEGIIYYEAQNDFSDLVPGPYTVFATNPRDDGPGLLLFHQTVQVDGRGRQVVQVRFEGDSALRLY